MNVFGRCLASKAKHVHNLGKRKGHTWGQRWKKWKLENEGRGRRFLPQHGGGRVCHEPVLQLLRAMAGLWSKQPQSGLWGKVPAQDLRHLSLFFSWAGGGEGGYL